MIGWKLINQINNFKHKPNYRNEYVIKGKYLYDF